jgi:hypothetical protein
VLGRRRVRGVRACPNTRARQGAHEKETALGLCRARSRSSVMAMAVGSPADVQPGTGPLAEGDPDLHGAGLSSAVPRREHGAALLAVNKTKYEGQISQAR